LDRRQLRASRRARITHALASRNHADKNFSIVLEDKPMAILVEDRPQTSAHLDDMHVGDITGGLGTIRRSDTGARRTLRQRLLTFFAIVGPGLIVMVGDNDAGAFGTYTQAGQNYGTTLLWTLLIRSHRP
jgi:hypothetical protein